MNGYRYEIKRHANDWCVFDHKRRAVLFVGGESDCHGYVQGLLADMAFAP